MSNDFVAAALSRGAEVQRLTFPNDDRPCRLREGIYNLSMSKRTTPTDADKIAVAADLEELVQDKREGWRASGAKARRRQRRYKSLLTQHLLKLGQTGISDLALDEDA